MICRPVTLGLTFALLPVSAAYAAGGGEHSFGHTVIVGVVNSGILFTALIFALRKPLREYFSTRARDLKEAIEAAGKARVEAERLLAEAKDKIAKADADVAALRQRFETEAKAESEHLRREAEKTATRIIEDAKAMAEGERERALIALRAEANRLATELAEQKARSTITASDQTRLAGEFVTRLGGVQ